MKRYGVFFLILLFISGCAARYQIITNGYLDRTQGLQSIPVGATFAVLSNKTAPNPIFENEVKNKIEALLLSKGYRLASEDQAQYFITFNYDISGSMKTSMSSQYVTEPSLIHRVYVQGSGKSYTVISPSFSYVTRVPETYMSYTAKLFLKVLDAPSLRSEKEQVVWVGDTVSESVNYDLRESIDYLLAATFRFFGLDTVRSQRVTISPNDPELQALRITPAQKAA